MDNGVDAGQKRLTEQDALAFLKDVKVAFQDEREKYDEFIKIMKDFKAFEINTIGVRSRVNELFKGHKDLILGFNNFLPNGYKMGDGVDARQNLTMNDALGFLKAVKVAFQNEREKYDEFLKIMKDFRAKRTDTIGVISRVKDLFKEHIHLVLGSTTSCQMDMNLSLLMS
ncbi:paired amphipathic helix protein Sin3-like 2 [Trifolium pratense]|uniref:paired amphipathic helix protein Sin3-like 2 n=1 Tax=Trifolium pratense TaxID=57577 RepID=UPI001E6949F1|nr:paired amphipathic helix protein Sin3-like 2 [Trifolium pratense]